MIFDQTGVDFVKSFRNTSNSSCMYKYKFRARVNMIKTIQYILC